MLRRFSSWIASSTTTTAGKPSSATTSTIDVETLFLDNRVQSILRKITGLSTAKVFRQRQYGGRNERPSYRLMTRDEFDEIQANVADKAKERLQIPPFKNPRSEESTVISKDSEIAGGDNAKMVFYDISPGLKATDRLALVRDIDGTLRTGTGGERDRLYRAYFPSPNRPVVEPPIFSEPRLTGALDEGKHEFVLDFACWYFEPDDPRYNEVCCATFDHMDKTNQHELLWSTRHYGTLAFYLSINRRIDNLLGVLLSNQKLPECAEIVRLYQICNQSCKTTDATDDLELIKNFAKSDAQDRQRLENLIQAFEEASRSERGSSEDATVKLKS